MMSASSSSPSTTSWRISFLTLRDETLTPLSRASLSSLLQSTVFSHSHHLMSAASLLPPHEVTSDLVFLMELFESCSDGSAEDLINPLTHFTHLIHGVSQHVSLELSSPSWDLMVKWFGKLVELLFGKPGNIREFRGRKTASARTIVECLGTLRHIANQRKFSPTENNKLLRFLLKVLECSHADLSSSARSNGNQKYVMGNGKYETEYINFWEAQTISFAMIGEIFTRAGPASIPLDSWQSVLEVTRKIMDSLTSKNLLVEDYVTSKFYLSVLSCLHLVLADPKGSLSDHVAGFVAALRPFFIYGLTSRTQMVFPISSNKDKERSSLILKSSSLSSAKNDHRPYRPPHLRKKDDKSMIHSKGTGHQSSSDQESSPVDVLSSDSDYSDSDGSGGGANTVQCSKVRVAAIVCIQDLCQNDPKSFSAQWTMLLPTTEVLQPRKYEGNLMACLLFDPHLKARMGSASTLAVMLDGPASVFLQVAEYKESAKCGSFTALSTSLGQILMQLHSGVLYLIQRETHGGLLVSLFKILMLLVQSTPYPRMPGDLLPSVIQSLKARIEEGFPYKSDQTSLLGISFSCLTAALATPTSSPQLKEILLAESSSGFSADQVKRGILFTIFMYSEQVTRLTVTFEALQALRAVSHNYPSVVAVCWEKVSTIIYGILRLIPSEHARRSWRGQDGNSVGPLREKIVAAAAKVLDESLRAISGFKGTEDHLDDRSMDTPFLSDCIRIKNISSAPFHGMERAENPVDNMAGAGESGNEQWHEALERHIPLILQHASPMVRAAAVTCFAGITSSVFFSLSKEKQDYILFSLINAAEKDDVSSVRSAACRAIGVIACFPQTFQSAEILQKFVHIAECNTRDPLVPVRIASSWALANICDSLRRLVHDYPCRSLLTESEMGSQLMASLVGCALHLTKDNDKIKANAVRALGNLSRLVKYRSSTDAQNIPSDSVALFLRCNKTEVLSSNSDSEVGQNTLSSYKHPYFGDSHWLEKMVQAFLSCVTTGNVKVQWNVCHALSNLFLNETLRLNEVEWASSVFSILLLLLRDSSNFKIRIQAAAALAVPASICDYGRSFSDVVQSLQNVIENLSSDKISTPSNMKYRVALEKQLISTMLHVLSLASNCDHQPLKDFLIKKASFLEEWLKMLCKSVGDEGTQPDAEINPVAEQKKEMLSKAICSLVEVYKSRNQQTIAQRYELLVVDKNQ